MRFVLVLCTFYLLNASPSIARVDVEKVIIERVQNAYLWPALSKACDGLGFIDDKTTFSDLSPECLQAGLEHSGVVPLVNLAHLKNEYFAAIKEILRQRLAWKTMILVRSGFGFNPDDDFSQFDDEGSARITSTSTMENLLTQFGQLISKLEIHSDLRANAFSADDTPIFGLVNEHCSALTVLNITKRYDNIFAEFKKPFTTVESLSLEQIRNVYNTSFNLSETFPSVRRLNLKEVNPFLLKESKLPLLEELAFTNSRPTDPKLLEDLINSNLQIRSLALTRISSESLRFVLKTLPLIEHLKLDQFQPDPSENADFHFENLRTLAASSLPRHTTFDSLEELTFGSELDGDQLFGLTVGNKKTLKKVHSGCRLNHTQISQLANTDLNLTELNFVCSSDCTLEEDINSVIELLEKSYDLIQLDLIVDGTHDRIEAYKKLKKHFGVQWDVNMVWYNRILMKRQTNNGGIMRRQTDNEGNNQNSH